MTEMRETASMRIADLETPAVLIDLDVLDRNLRHTAGLARKAGVKLRPHFKTHKSVWIARMQIEYGACGLTVAKLGEAEVLVEAGIRDLLVAYPIIGRAKLARLGRLLEQARIIVGIDSMRAAEGLSELAQSLKRSIEIYVDVDTGLHRCGKEPGEATAALVREMVQLPGLDVIGLMTHRGLFVSEVSPEGIRAAARQEAEGLVETKRLLARDGIPIPEISVGSTPTSKLIHEQTGVTELRAGAYVYGDGSQLACGVITAEECAMHVLTTVVSTPRRGTVIIDAGSKTFTSDGNAKHPGYGMLKNRPDIYVERLSEEHGNVRVPDEMTDAFSIGDRLRVLPNHCCTVSNLHDQLYGIRGDSVERMITVDARGRIV